MPMTDPLGDMLTRIRNGQQAKKDTVLSPASKPVSYTHLTLPTICSV